jgi:glycosyltransferase involved in cell wall biosynthesis
MRVGLDLLYLVPGETGGRETYARELVPALLAREPGLELVAFVNRDAGAALAAELGEGVGAIVVPVSARSRPQWAAGELALVAAAARRARVELLHSMANFAPPWGPFKRVVTIHDLQHRAVPERISAPVRALTDALIRLAAARADRIIAVSAAGAEELRGELGVAPGRIDVVPNGVRLPAEQLARVQQGDRPVVLSVATNLPHKNLPALIDALALIERDRRPLLVLAGHGTDDGSLQQHARMRGVELDVRALGACTREQLDELYASSRCLALASLHEGFGLPVLEAMARSLPVACSDIAALREVGGAAALYFYPRDPQAIAAALEQAGRERAGAFSWAAAAEGTLASYRRALGHG